MKKNIIIGFLGIVVAAFTADYTIPKTWTRTGAEYATAATYTFDPLHTDKPVQIVVRIHQVAGDDARQVWTAALVEALPDSVTNSINGNVTANRFKILMGPLFDRTNIVQAFNWSLIDGREASMVVGGQ
jgi:hypothetical protein